MYKKKPNDNQYILPNDSLDMPIEPITRSRNNKIKEAFDELIQDI